MKSACAAGLALLGPILLSIASAADSPPPQTGPSPYTLIAQDRDFAHRPHFDLPGGVTRLPQVIYSVLNGYRPLTLDLFVPKDDGKPHPIVVYIHGGGWTLDPYGDEGLASDDAMAELAARGYLVVRPSYRLSSEAKFPAQLIDVKTAIRWTKTYAPVYRGDPTRVLVWGSSAGGNLSALAGTSCKAKQFEQTTKLGKFYGLSTAAIDPNVDSCVQAAIDWFGPTDFAAMASEAPPGASKHDTPDGAESQYVGCTIPACPAATLAAANPVTYVNKSNPPFLIMHGLADVSVPPQQSELLADALKSQGVPVKLVLVPGAKHMFFGVSQPIMHQQLDIVLAWIDQQMKSGGAR